MACDICGKTGKTLVDLREQYRTASIMQICPSCETVINKHLVKVREVTHNMLWDLMKSFIRSLGPDSKGSGKRLGSIEETKHQSPSVPVDMSCFNAEQPDIDVPVRRK